MNRLVPVFRLWLVLFAGYFVGIHVAVLLHELGHAMGVWARGGSVTAFVIYSPIPAGYVASSIPSGLANVWGGVVVGALSAACLALVDRWFAFGPPFNFVLCMSAALGFSHNALYLVVGGLVPYADALAMIQLGASRWLLFCLGLPLLAAFVMLLTRALQMVDSGGVFPTWKWMLVVETAMLLVPGIMIVSLLTSSRQTPERRAMPLYLLILAVCYGVAAYRARATPAEPAIEARRVVPGWSAAARLIGIGVLLLAMEWLVSHRNF